MGGQKTTTTTKVERTPEEIEYTKQQIELAKQQLKLIEEEHGWQGEIYALTKPLLEKYMLMLDQDFTEMNSPEYQARKQKQNELETAQLDSALKNLPVQDELLQMQLDEIRRGGRATPEQQQLIAEIANRAIESGETDINRFLGQGLDQIRNQMAPARGMRPDDGPMIDAAQRVLEEAVRQQGQMTAGVRGSQAEAELNFPLNAGNVVNSWNQWQQTFNQNMNQFLSGMKTQAMQNRTALMGQLFATPMTASERGMNLINMSRPNPVNFPQNTTTTQKTSGGSILGGIGGLLSGIGSVGSMFSSKRAKTNIKPLEAPPGHMLSPGFLKQNFRDLGGMGNVQTLGNPGGGGFNGKMVPNQPQTQPPAPGKGPITGPQIDPVWLDQDWKPPTTVQPPRDEDDALMRLRNLPISSWQYKPETGLGGPTHVGPMAEDFNTIMMGKRPEPFINTVDAVGSLMASVKALDKKVSGIGLQGSGRKQRRVAPWPRG